jgi:hypothetical protein
MSSHLDGGSGALSATLTTVLNSSAADRYLLIHVAASVSGTVTLDRGTGTFRKLQDATPIAAGSALDLGPYFIPNGHSLRGGITTGTADYSIDEVRP